MPATNVPTQPAALNANLHVQPGHVSAVGLRPGGDLVSLRLGDDNATVDVLGSLAQLYAIVQAAADALDAVAGQ